MQINFLTSLIIALTAIGVAQVSHAEIDFKDLKGARNFLGLKEECSYLSPEIPLGLTHQGKLNQDYHYGDEFDPEIKFIKTAFNSVSENPGFFQVSPLARNVASLLPPELIGKILGSIISSDKTSGKPPGGATKESLKALIISDLGFQQQIALVEKRKLEAIKSREEYLASQQVRTEINRLGDEIKARDAKYRADRKEKHAALMKLHFPEGDVRCSPQEKKLKLAELKKDLYAVLNPYFEETKKREASLKELKEKLQKDEVINKLNGLVEKYSYREANLDHFLELLTQALKDESLKVESATHRVEQALLSLGWMNGSKKDDLLSMYKGLPQRCFSDKGYRRITSDVADDKSARERFLRQQFTQLDYAQQVTEVMTKTPDARAEYFLDHPDELAFLSQGRPYFDSSALPTMGLKSISFTHPISKAEVSMPDCMEYAIVNNMLNGLAGGVGNQFDVSVLEKNLMDLGYQMHPGLKEFLTTYPDPSQVNELPAHKEWAELVSGLPNVEYNPAHPTYEVKPTVSNALAIYEYLLFHKKIRVGAKPYSTHTRAEKLDSVCKVLSRDNRKIDWKLQGSNSKEGLNAPSSATASTAVLKDTDLVLEFEINGQPKYDWVIGAGHSQVDLRAVGTSDWRAGVGAEMAKRIFPPTVGEYEAGRTDSAKTSSQNRRALAWFLETSDAPQIFKVIREGKQALGAEIVKAKKEGKSTVSLEVHDRENSSQYEELLASVSLESHGSKFLVIGELSELGKVKEIEKIRAKLPQEFMMQQRYHATLADHNYPFDEKVKTVSGAEYTRVSNDRLKAKFGESVAKQMGRTWMREMHGRPVAIGEPLIENGVERKLKFDQAVQACLDLNPHEIRDEVEKKFHEREAALDQVRRDPRWKWKDSECPEDLKKRLSEIHKSMPIPGIYLMSKEEWGLIEGDMGFREKKYLPQILPKVVNRLFWSGSGDPKDAFFSYVFAGNIGFVYSDNSNYGKTVRCVAEMG